MTNCESEQGPTLLRCARVAAVVGVVWFIDWALDDMSKRQGLAVLWQALPPAVTEGVVCVLSWVLALWMLILDVRIAIEAFKDCREALKK